MERLKRMSVFAKVVEFGSFTAAARQLQMSVSSISQTVSKLEDELQVKLLNRSTRSIGLTEAGRIYYQGCRRMLHEVQDVHEQLYAFNNTPMCRFSCAGKRFPALYVDETEKAAAVRQEAPKHLIPSRGSLPAYQAAGSVGCG